MYKVIHFIRMIFPSLVPEHLGRQKKTPPPPQPGMTGSFLIPRTGENFCKRTPDFPPTQLFRRGDSFVIAL